VRAGLLVLELLNSPADNPSRRRQPPSGPHSRSSRLMARTRKVTAVKNKVEKTASVVRRAADGDDSGCSQAIGLYLIVWMMVTIFFMIGARWPARPGTVELGKVVDGENKEGDGGEEQGREDRECGPEGG
jgi:hypothetical protein